ncbi:MAG: VanZ family protein [Nanoarchaeota archaeon]
MVIIWFERHSNISWIITFIIAIFIFYMSSFAPEISTSTTNLLSPVYHFFIFFSLTFFIQISSLKGDKKLNIFFLVLVIAITYSALDELHQYFVPGRVCSFGDFFIDSSGIILASLIYLITIRYRNR